MKKVLVLLAVCFMVAGAKNVFANAIVSAQQADARIVNSVDVIFAGYVNKIVEYKNTVDFRLNAASGAFGGGSSEWGGIIDGKHESIGVVGVYINRPNTQTSYNSEPTLWGTVGGVAAWTGMGVGLPGGVLPTVWIGSAGSQVGSIPGASPSYAALNAVIPTPVNKVDVFWASNIGDSSNFGIGLSYGDNQASNAAGVLGGNGTVTNSDPVVIAPINQVDNTFARNVALNLGLGLKNVGFLSSVDIHAGYNFGTFTVSETTNVAASVSTNVYNVSINDNGISTITLGVLGQHDMDKETNLRMFLDGVLNTFNTKAVFLNSPTNSGYRTAGGDTAYENTTSWSQFVLNAGFGCNHSVNDGAAVVGSSFLGNFATASTSATESFQTGSAASVPTTFTGVNSYNTSSINISWGTNVDAKVADWLKVRAGIRKSIFNRTGFTGVVAGTTNTVTGKGSADALAAAGAAFSTGFGINWQNWVLNTNVTAASLESSIAGVQPGRGLLFTGNIVTVAEADLAYAF